MLEYECIFSEDPNEPTLIFGIKGFKNTNKILIFTIMKYDYESVKTFLDSLDDEALVEDVVKYLRSQGFKENIK